jgi:hypothetical protein
MTDNEMDALREQLRIETQNAIDLEFMLGYVIGAAPELPEEVKDKALKTVLRIRARRTTGTEQ